MKKLIFALIVSLTGLQASAQRNNELVLNNQTISDNLKGTWTLLSAQPNDKEVTIRGINMKGMGFGEIIKMTDGVAKTVICKIYATNNNAITFNDGDGARNIYTVISLTKTTMQLSDGKTTMNFGLVK
jgi:hypothetical protein